MKRTLTILSLILVLVGCGDSEEVRFEKAVKEYVDSAENTPEARIKAVAFEDLSKHFSKKSRAIWLTAYDARKEAEASVAKFRSNSPPEFIAASDAIDAAKAELATAQSSSQPEITAASAALKRAMEEFDAAAKSTALGGLAAATAVVKKATTELTAVRLRSQL